MNHLDASAKMVPLHVARRGLRLHHRVLHRLVRRHPVRAGLLLESRVRAQWWWAAWIMLTCNMILPRCRCSRRSCAAIRPGSWILSIFINIGMWFERFVIVVPSLSHDVEPWQWSSYVPTWVDYGLLIGSFGWFFMWFLLFVKQLPVMALRRNQGDRAAEDEEQCRQVPRPRRALTCVSGHGWSLHGARRDGVRAIEELKKHKNLGKLTVYSPTPRHELEHARSSRRRARCASSRSSARCPWCVLRLLDRDLGLRVLAARRRWQGDLHVVAVHRVRFRSDGAWSARCRPCSAMFISRGDPATHDDRRVTTRAFSQWAYYGVLVRACTRSSSPRPGIRVLRRHGAVEVRGDRR